MAKENSQFLTSLPKPVFPNPLLVVNEASSGRAISSIIPDDQKVILKQILASHAHDARVVDAKPVLDVVENIFHRTNVTADAVRGKLEDFAHVDALEEKIGAVPAGPKGTMLDELAGIIRKVCCEFSCKCSGGDAHASAMSILDMLGSYSWDAKVIIALAAFAVAYGEFWLVTLLEDSNPLARAITVLKQTPELSEINGELRAKYNTLNEVIKVMVEVAKCLIEFRSLPAKYISPEDAPLATSTNQIMMATYWTIRSIVACGAQVSTNFGTYSGLPSTATEAWDISSLVHKEKSIYDLLIQRLTVCYDFIEKRKEEERFNNLLMLFKTATVKDNVKILKALIYPKEDIQPLLDISTKKRVSIDVLRGKTVLLFVSDLDIREEDIRALDKIFKESRKKKTELQYEIVWLPVIDKTEPWTKEHENKFKELQYKMSWYSLLHPSLLDAPTIKFIKEVWGFCKKEIVVSLNSVGQVVTQNALHMIYVWGNSAYPFTSVKEEEMWKSQTWNLDFLVDAIHPDISKWLSSKDTHICLIGGEDIEWIRKFVTTTKEQTTKTGIKIEIVYVGKNNANEAVKRVMDIMTKEKLAHTLPDVYQVHLFWTRLESMLYSKMHQGKNADNDNIVKEVMSLMNYDGSDQGWGVLGQGGSTEIVKAKGDTIITVISQISESSEKIKKNGFIAALIDLMNVALSAHRGKFGHYHCNKLIMPSIPGAEASGVVSCIDCGHPMEKYILYRCCTG